MKRSQLVAQDESQLKETFEDLNKLFQGLQDSQAEVVSTASPVVTVVCFFSK